MSVDSVAIEFYVFIAVAAWLVFSQWRGPRRGAEASEAERPGHREGPPPT